MDSKSTQAQMEERLGIIWSLVLLQGGILVVSTLESLVANATQGFALIAISIVTGMAVVLALMSARGLRRQKRWARRLTLVAEWFVLTLGSMELVATQLLDSTGPDIVPVLTGIVVPSVVLLLLRSTKPLFKRNEPSAEIEVLV